MHALPHSLRYSSPTGRSIVNHAGLAVLLLTTLVVSAGSAVPANTGPYTFTNIADTTGPFNFFNPVALINARGTVAFSAGLDAGGLGIFIGSGGRITTIVDTGGPLNATFFPAINAGGTVAFVAELDAGGKRIFVSRGGPLTTIADTGGPFSDFLIGPAINAGGTVAFTAELVTGGHGVFTGRGGPLTTIADTNGPLDSISFPAINANGTVAFNGRLDDGRFGIFAGRGGAITTIADSRAPANSFMAPAINAHGTVAFAGDLDTGAGGIFTGRGGPLTTIVDGSGPFNGYSFPSLAIDSNGTVAFAAERRSRREDVFGIFTGPDPMADKVIGTGDALFGSTVTIVGFFSSMAFLNDAGQVAFFYQLADGRTGIARAAPVP
jgi:hypothetical protein